MFKRLLVILMLIPLLLVACSGIQADVETQVVDGDAALAVVEAPPAVEPTQPEPAKPEPATEDSSSAAGLEMECTLVSNLPEAPAELVEIFGVKEDDWVKGSETAAVTIVEYSDFQ